MACTFDAAAAVAVRAAPPHPPPPTPSGPSVPTRPHWTRARLGRPPNPHPNLDLRQAEVERAAKVADGHQASEVQSNPKPTPTT